MPRIETTAETRKDSSQRPPSMSRASRGTIDDAIGLCSWPGNRRPLVGVTGAGTLTPLTAGDVSVGSWPRRSAGEALAQLAQAGACVGDQLPFVGVPLRALMVVQVVGYAVVERHALPPEPGEHLGQEDAFPHLAAGALAVQHVDGRSVVFQQQPP